jgi:RES domain-containing protein
MSRADLTAAFRTIPEAPPRGSFFRAIPLEHRTTPLSAIGSIRRGGRYNPRDEFEAYYLAESPETTLYELRVLTPDVAPARMKPTVTFTVDVVLQHAVALTTPEKRTILGVRQDELILEWRAILARGGVPATHEIGRAARDTNVGSTACAFGPHI